jgi:hypothetical protein
MIFICFLCSLSHNSLLNSISLTNDLSAIKPEQLHSLLSLFYSPTPVKDKHYSKQHLADDLQKYITFSQ